MRAFILSSSRDWFSQGYQVVALGAFKSNNFGISENTVNLIVDEANCDGLEFQKPGYEVVLKTIQTPTSFATVNFGASYLLEIHQLHLNWGWTKDYNILYNDYNFNVDGDVYNNRKDIMNIYP